MELLVDENSALTRTNLRALILDPEVWKLLTPEQIARVQKYWPGDSFNGGLNALASNDHLRHDIVEYQKALAAGQHDAEWIRQAKAANQLRNELLATNNVEVVRSSDAEKKQAGGATNGETDPEKPEEKPEETETDRKEA